MKVPHTPRPKRRTRPYRKKKKPQQATPELGDLFDHGVPIKPSPSANSSFTSAFNKSIKIGSGHTTPLRDCQPIGLSALSHATTQVEGINSRNFSGDSHRLSVAEDQGSASHNAENISSPSEGDTEVNQFDLASEPDEHLKKSPGQSITIRPGSQDEQDEQKPSIAALAGPIGTPSFHRGLLGQQNGSHIYPTSTTNQYTTAIKSSPFISPTTPSYPRSAPISSNNNSCCNTIPPAPHHGYTNSTQNTPQQPLVGAPAFRTPYLPQSRPHNHFLAPPPTPTHNPSFTVSMHPTNEPTAAAPMPQPQTLAAGYPSFASSYFNGAMPIDSEWHRVDDTFEIFRDGTYQMRQQHAADSLHPVSSNNYHQPQPHVKQEPQDQTGFNNAGIGSVGGVWANEWEAMSHDPQRYCPMASQPQPPHLQLQGMGPPAVAAPGGGVVDHGAMQRVGSGYGYVPSLGGRG